MNEAIKICFNDRIKRVLIPNSFLNLTQTICDLFSINNINFNQYYFDDENDHIVIENEYDYKMALLFADSSNSTLKIFIKFPEDNEYLNKKPSMTQLKTEDFLGQEVQMLEFYCCRKCQRKFSNRRSYQIHSRICDKLFNKKGEKFNMSKKRLEGIALDNGINMNALLDICSKGKETEKEREYKKCDKCLRKFHSSAIDKHVMLCKKKREPFNSKKQRAYYPENMYFYKKKSEKKIKRMKKLDWKIQSKRFRTIIRIAREMMKTE